MHLTNVFRRIAAGMILGLVVLLAGSAQASDWYVNTNAGMNGSDTYSPSGVQGTASGTPYLSIRFAIGHLTNNTYLTLTGTDIVHVAAGTYTETIIVNTNCIIRGDSGPALTIVQANALTNTATVATFQLGYTNVVTLDGLTIQNGKGALYGGGIAVSGNQGGLFGSFNATITNCVIRNNIMANINGAGGGIALGVAGNTGNSPGSGTVPLWIP